MVKMYHLFIDGDFYGSGSLEYMNELISDLLSCGIYGNSTANFEIKLVQREKVLR